ncbi:hypothetical protein [Streptomyces sp. NPDC005374]|uniref:hypothetical protein n=1 Tax=Streptomyces sp. NPDC005374 TaxID=3364713 RepID=UPI00367575EB
MSDRPEGVVWGSDKEFAAHGIGPEETAELRRRALDRGSGLGLRPAEEYDDPDDHQEDAYG